MMATTTTKKKKQQPTSISVVCNEIEIRRGKLQKSTMYQTEEDAVVSLDGKHLLFGPRANWSMKIKHMTDLRIIHDDNDEPVVELHCSDGEKQVRIVPFKPSFSSSMPKQQQQQQWQSFLTKLQKMYHKYRVPTKTATTTTTVVPNQNLSTFARPQAQYKHKPQRTGVFGKQARWLQKNNRINQQQRIPSTQLTATFSWDDEDDENEYDEPEKHNNPATTTTTPISSSASNSEDEQQSQQPEDENDQDEVETVNAMEEDPNTEPENDDNDDDMASWVSEPPPPRPSYHPQIKKKTIKRKIVQQKKLRKLQKGNAASDDDESEDDAIFETTSTLTTPATHRVVSPTTTTTTGKTQVAAADSTIDDDDASSPDSPTHPRPSSSSRPTNTTISKFFQKRNPRKHSLPQSFVPGNTSAPTQTVLTMSPSVVMPKTPPRPNSNAARFSNEIQQKRKRSLASSQEKQWIQQSANRLLRSPDEKRKSDLHIPTHNHHHQFHDTNNNPAQPEFDNDSLEDSSPEQKQRKVIRKCPLYFNITTALTTSRPRKSLSPPRQPLVDMTTRLNTTTKNTTVTTTTEPSSRLRGLRNLGNTCYLNASLQMIVTCHTMIRALQNQLSRPRTTNDADIHSSIGGNHPSSPKNIHHNMRLTRSVCEIAQQLQILRTVTEPFVSVNPRIVKEAMDEKSDKFAGYEQRDAHEFLNDLVDEMHQELLDRTDKTNDNSSELPLPTNDFCLTVDVCLTCKSCGYTRHKEEMYRHLSIDIIGDDEHGEKSSNETSPFHGTRNASVEKSLQHFFQPEEREIRCEKCRNGTHALQTLRILSRPKALILHLKRFIVVERPKITVEQKEGENLSPNAPTKPVVMEYVFQKKKTPVAIPATLTLDPFRMLVKDAGEHSTQEYSLNSVVHHIGSHASSGHYTADAVRLIPSDSAAKTIDTDSGEIASEQQLQETWIRFDDGQTTITDLEEVIKPVTKQQSAYMLLYTLNINDT